MPSEPKKIDMLDVKRWGVVALIGAGIGAINAIAGQIIPEISDMGGQINAAIVLVLTFAVDFARRYLTDTRVVEPEEVEKLVVNTKNEDSVKEDKVSLLDWILRRK
jgi:uncharacterized protein (DUF697 family)